MDPQIGTIDSHYVQKARLKNFSWQEGNHQKLFVVDLTQKKIGSRNIESAFYQKGLYTNDVESEMNEKIEKPGMKVFDKAYNSEDTVTLTREELNAMHKYLLVQLYRNPTNMSQYSPNWDGDILGINKEYRNDAEAYKHISEEIHTICSTPWRDLINTKDKELWNNVFLMGQSLTMFVRSKSLEFVINDLGSVCERHPYIHRDKNLLKACIKNMMGIDFPEDLLDEWISKHQYCDNFTFYPVSSNFGIVTLDLCWANLIKQRQPYTVTFNGSNVPKISVDQSFFDWVAQNMGIYSKFIQELYLPCINRYESPLLQKSCSQNLTPEERGILFDKYASPKDEFIYPIIDLNLEWAEYLNGLTINESNRYFAFKSQTDGKTSIANYELRRLMYCQSGEAKHNLDWIDPYADWKKPLN